MRINTDFLDRCINTLESAVEQLQQREPGDTFYSTPCARLPSKSSRPWLEQSGNLLKKRLRPYFASNRQADRLTFKNIFRHAARHDLISLEACERLVRLPGQPERHRAQRWRGLRGDNAPTAAGLHRGCEGRWRES